MNPCLSRAAATFFLVSAVCGSFGAAAQSTPAPHLPDLSLYDCASVSAGTAASTRHIGQVIKGRYSEWNEFYVLSNGESRLACIGVMRPAPKQLNRTEAAAFLTDAFAVGAPSTLSRPQAAPDAAAPVEPDPQNVQPEPLKRVRKPPVSGDGSPGAEKKSSTPDPSSDQPPVPATKDFGTEGAVVAPSKERATGLAAQPAIAPALKYETPATVGVEDREQIPSTQVYPWNTLAYLEVTYPSGSTFRCSATLVSPYVVLTAGHCVHDKTRGGYITSARVYPGQNQTSDGVRTRPYGSKSDIQQAQTTQEWTQISGDDSYLVAQYRYDLAAIEFKTPFTHTSTFMPVLYSSTGSPITDAGYPAVVAGHDPSYGLWADTGGETNDSFFGLHTSHVREFLVDASAGDSGGSFLYADPSTGQRYLVGSLSYGNDLDDEAGGPWYDSWNQALVSGWVSWTPSTAAAGSLGGLRVASIFGSTQANLVSYLRFYNAGSTSGTVDVTLADYTTGNALATWTSPGLPGHSSKQFAIADIESGANTTFNKSLVYSISVRPTFSGSFQNILWRKVDATITNLSTCNVPSTDQTTLMNVHTSLLAGYPSVVVIHNTGANSVSLTLGIYHQQTGQRLGTYPTGQIPANGQQLLTIQTIEAGAGITPAASGAYHYNIKSDTAFTGYLQHLLNNQAAGMTTDMTEACAMSP